ncbi:hypothetical protein BGZ57DRAFT_996917 [Hyaloscypha finlandica]|nr:hypothetical protein BGZ57DRAFT_996917 [Hyaloscypha finlandica]
MASPNRDEVFEDSSEQGATFNGTSSASGTGSTLFQNIVSLPDPSAGQDGAAAALDSASTSTKSTGSYRISYTPCGGSVSSLPPHASAPQEHPSPYECSYPGCHRIGTNGWMRERDMVKHMKKEHEV